MQSFFEELWLIYLWHSLNKNYSNIFISKKFYTIRVKFCLEVEMRKKLTLRGRLCAQCVLQSICDADRRRLPVIEMAPALVGTSRWCYALCSEHSLTRTKLLSGLRKGQVKDKASAETYNLPFKESAQKQKKSGKNYARGSSSTLLFTSVRVHVQLFFSRNQKNTN